VLIGGIYAQRQTTSEERARAYFAERRRSSAPAASYMHTRRSEDVLGLELLQMMASAEGSPCHEHAQPNAQPKEDIDCSKSSNSDASALSTFDAACNNDSAPPLLDRPRPVQYEPTNVASDRDSSSSAPRGHSQPERPDRADQLEPPGPLQMQSTVQSAPVQVCDRGSQRSDYALQPARQSSRLQLHSRLNWPNDALLMQRYQQGQEHEDYVGFDAADTSPPTPTRNREH
jgi:hypothetical protein